MDWVIAISENLVSSAIWKIFVALATTAFAAWLWARWALMSRASKIWAGSVAYLLIAAVVIVAYIKTKPERATGPFAILVADLDGDVDHSQSRHVRQSLRTQFGEYIQQGFFEVLSRGEALVIPRGNLRTAEEAVAATGSAWLKEQNAKLLIWGEVAVRDKVLRLRFLRAGGDDYAKSYALDEQVFELPTDFRDDIATLFAKQVMKVYALPNLELFERKWRTQKSSLDWSQREDWAIVEDRAGTALWEIGNREASITKASGCATLKIARQHWGVALELFQMNSASRYVEDTQAKIARLDDTFGRICASRAW